MYVPMYMYMYMYMDAATAAKCMYVLCYIYCSAKVSFGRFTVEEDALGKMWRKSMFLDIHACN